MTMIMESENKKVRRRSSTSSSLKRPGGGGGGVGVGGGLVGVRNLLEAARASVGGSVPSIHSSNQSLSPSDIFAKGDEGEEDEESVSDFDTSTMIPTFSNHAGGCNDEFSGHTRIITTEVPDTTTCSTGSSKNPTIPSHTLPSLLYNDSMIFDDNIEIHDLISEEQPHKPKTTTSSLRERSSKMPPSSSPRRASKNPSLTATPIPRVRQPRRNSTGQQQIATSSSTRPKEEPSPQRPPSPAAIPSWAAHVGTIFVAVASNHDEEACDYDDMHPAFRVEEKPTVRRVKNTSNSKNHGIKKKRPTGETTIRKPNPARPQQQQQHERNGDRPASSNNISNTVSSGTNSSPRRTSKARQDEHMEIGSSSSDNNNSKTPSSPSRPKKTSTTTKPQNTSPDGTPRRMRRRVSLDSKRTQICSNNNNINNNINKCEIRPTPPLRKKTISMDNERHQVFHNSINDINKKPSRPPTTRRTTNGTTPAAKQQQKGLDDDDGNNNNASCNIIMSPSTTTRRASKTSTNNLTSSRPQGKRPRRLSQ